MTTISDGFMRDLLATTKPYTLVLLRATPKLHEPGMDAVVWEHGRRTTDSILSQQKSRKRPCKAIRGWA